MSIGRFGDNLENALRAARRSPVSWCINVLTLALGLTCFLIAWAVAVYWAGADRHFADSGRIEVITTQVSLRSGSMRLPAQANANRRVAAYLETDFPALERVARAHAFTGSVATGDRALRLRTLAVDPAFLDIFALPTRRGSRSAGSLAPGSVLLTQQSAARLFGSTPAVGKSLILGNRVEVTVTGVLAPIRKPTHLHFDVLVPWSVLESLEKASGASRSGEISRNNWLNLDTQTYALLPADGSLSALAFKTQMGDFAARHVPARAFAKLTFSAVPLTALPTGNVDRIFWALSGHRLTAGTTLLLLGLLVLVIACINYANLATAQATGRAKDVGLRKTVGAKPRQLAAQYLTEVGMQTSAALVISVAALVLLHSAVNAITGIALTSSGEFHSVALWVTLIALLTGVTLLAGAYPAFVLARFSAADAVRLGTIRSGPRRLSTVLVAVQFAAASLLLIAVAVMSTQNAALRRLGPDRARRPLLVIQNRTEVTGIATRTLQAELRRTPGVLSVTGALQTPWSNAGLTQFSRSPDAARARHMAFRYYVGNGFFSTLDMHLLTGRALDAARDDVPAAGSESAGVVVDRAFARQMGFASPRVALGRIIFEGYQKPYARLRIVGVVENRTLNVLGGGSIHAGAAANVFEIGKHLPYQIVRLSDSDVAGTLQNIDALWKRLAPKVALQRRFLSDLFADSIRIWKRFAALFTGLALFALAISGVGLFGIAIVVARRRVHEIGIRKVLGASTRRIVGMLLVDFTKPVLLANLIVWPIAYAGASGYLALFAYRGSLTAYPFLYSLSVTIAVTWLVVGGQALRAARLRPADVMRFE